MLIVTTDFSEKWISQIAALQSSDVFLAIATTGFTHYTYTCEQWFLNFHVPSFPPGAPSIRKFQILRDKQHVLTKTTDDQVQLWDVLKVNTVELPSTWSYDSWTALNFFPECPGILSLIPGKLLENDTKSALVEIQECTNPVRLLFLTVLHTPFCWPDLNS